MNLRAVLAATISLVSVALMAALTTAAQTTPKPPGGAAFVVMPDASATAATVGIQMPSGVLIRIGVLNPTTGVFSPSGLGSEIGRAIASEQANATAAASALTAANAAVPKAGGTMTGSLGINSGAAQGTNNVSQEKLTGTTGYNWLGVSDGTVGAPSTTTDPPIFVQRHVLRDLGSEYAQTVTGHFVDIVAHGSGTTTPARGATMAGLFSNTCAGVNQGSTSSPNFDLNGDCIGLAGFAASNGALYNGHITTGVWAWGKGPTLDATTYANLPATNWSTVGSEINVSYNHPDPGVQSTLVGKGTTVGQLINNYRPQNAGIADLTFGQFYSGVPNDGNYGSTDITNYSGYHTAAYWNAVKNYGLRFGPLMAPGAYGIYFPDVFAGGAVPAAGIYMGGAKFNIGTFTGTVFNEGDVWQNNGRIHYAHTANSTTVNEKLLTDRAGVTVLSATHTFSNNGRLNLQLATVGSAVSYTTLYNAATGGSPAFVASGSDTNVGLELRAKGTGTLLLNGAVKALKPVQLPPYTVATLPTCGASSQDAMAVVTDATAPTYGGAVTIGGGSVRTPVYCDGRGTWRAH